MSSAITFLHTGRDATSQGSFFAEAVEMSSLKQYDSLSEFINLISEDSYLNSGFISISVAMNDIARKSRRSTANFIVGNFYGFVPDQIAEYLERSTRLICLNDPGLDNFYIFYKSTSQVNTKIKLCDGPWYMHGSKFYLNPFAGTNYVRRLLIPRT